MAQDGPRARQEVEWNGPLKNRTCTDIPCLIIFVIFMVCWIGVGFYAFIYGDIGTLIAPKDSQGRRCGIDSEVADKPYLIFFDLSKCINDRCHTPQVCLSQCPQSNWYFDRSQPIETIREAVICENGFNVTDKTVDELEDLIKLTKTCAPWYLESTPLIKRCFPKKIPADFIDNNIITSDILSKAKVIIEQLAKAEGIVNKVISTRVPVFLFICVSMVICLVYITLLRWFALPCIWIAIAALIGLLSYLTYLSYVECAPVNSWRGWIVLTMVLGISTGVITLLSVYLCSRISLACQLISEAGIAIIHILSSLFFPIFPWLLHLAVIVYFLVAGLYLISIGEKNFVIEEKISNGNCFCSMELNYTNGTVCDPISFYENCKEDGESCKSKGCHLQSITSPSIMIFLYIFHIAGFFWFYFFISALGEMILAATFATWYWTFHKRDFPWFTITVSTWRTIRYHIGTLAFGSFLITICELFKILIKYLHEQSVQSHPICDTLTRFCYRCSLCLVSCLEKCLKFMNRNAYIICAVSGKGLCASAADALSLLTRNVIRAVVLDNIVDLLLFIGKIVVTCLMVSTTWWYFKYSHYYVNDSEYWWVPTILVGIGSYLVSSVFFTVHSTAVSTIFLCVLRDCEVNDGTPEKPYYMSRRLGKLLQIYH